MSVSQQFYAILTDDSSQSTTLYGTAVSGNQLKTLSQAIAANQTNLLIPMVFLVADLDSIMMTVDQAMTLKTNSSGSPANTFSLSPLAPFLWQKSSGITNPFGTDVAAWYVTNTTAGTLRVRIVTN